MTQSKSSLFVHIPHIATETYTSPEELSDHLENHAYDPVAFTLDSSWHVRSRMLNERR